MRRAKVAITLDKALLGRVDRLVRQSVFPNRSRAGHDCDTRRS